MKTNQLGVGSWYLFGHHPKFSTINYTSALFCKYIGEDSKCDGSFPYIFHFFDGYVFNYSKEIVELSICPCPRHLYEYLDLFRLDTPNEEVV